MSEPTEPSGTQGSLHNSERFRGKQSEQQRYESICEHFREKFPSAPILLELLKQSIAESWSSEDVETELLMRFKVRLDELVPLIITPPLARIAISEVKDLLRTTSRNLRGRPRTTEIERRREIVGELMSRPSDLDAPEKISRLFKRLDEQRISLPNRKDSRPRSGLYGDLKGDMKSKVISTLKKDLQRKNTKPRDKK
jgi:hypothetical protein